MLDNASDVNEQLDFNVDESKQLSMNQIFQLQPEAEQQLEQQQSAAAVPDSISNQNLESGQHQIPAQTESVTVSTPKPTPQLGPNGLPISPSPSNSLNSSKPQVVRNQFAKNFIGRVTKDNVRIENEQMWRREKIREESESIQRELVLKRDGFAGLAKTAGNFLKFQGNTNIINTGNLKLISPIKKAGTGISLTARRPSFIELKKRDQLISPRTTRSQQLNQKESQSHHDYDDDDNYDQDINHSYVALRKREKRRRERQARRDKGEEVDSEQEEENHKKLLKSIQQANRPQVQRKKLIGWNSSDEEEEEGTLTLNRGDSSQRNVQQYLLSLKKKSEVVTGQQCQQESNTNNNLNLNDTVTTELISTTTQQSTDDKKSLSRQLSAVSAISPNCPNSKNDVDLRHEATEDLDQQPGQENNDNLPKSQIPMLQTRPKMKPKARAKVQITNLSQYISKKESEDNNNQNNLNITNTQESNQDDIDHDMLNETLNPTGDRNSSVLDHDERYSQNNVDFNDDASDRKVSMLSESKDLDRDNDQDLNSLNDNINIGLEIESDQYNLNHDYNNNSDVIIDQDQDQLQDRFQDNHDPERNITVSISARGTLNGLSPSSKRRRVGFNEIDERSPGPSHGGGSGIKLKSKNNLDEIDQDQDNDQYGPDSELISRPRIRKKSVTQQQSQSSYSQSNSNEDSKPSNPKWFLQQNSKDWKSSPSSVNLGSPQKGKGKSGLSQRERERERVRDREKDEFDRTVTRYERSDRDHDDIRIGDTDRDRDSEFIDRVRSRIQTDRDRDREYDIDYNTTNNGIVLSRRNGVVRGRDHLRDPLDDNVDQRRTERSWRPTNCQQQQQFQQDSAYYSESESEDQDRKQIPRLGPSRRDSEENAQQYASSDSDFENAYAKDQQFARRNKDEYAKVEIKTKSGKMLQLLGKELMKEKERKKKLKLQTDQQQQSTMTNNNLMTKDSTQTVVSNSNRNSSRQLQQSISACTQSSKDSINSNNPFYQDYAENEQSDGDNKDGQDKQAITQTDSDDRQQNGNSTVKGNGTTVKSQVPSKAQTVDQILDQELDTYDKQYRISTRVNMKKKIIELEAEEDSQNDNANDSENDKLHRDSSQIQRPGRKRTSIGDTSKKLPWYLDENARNSKTTTQYDRQRGSYQNNTNSKVTTVDSYNNVNPDRSQQDLWLQTHDS